MKERPILFSGAMVRAILDGRKTQTRRVVKPQPEQTRGGAWIWPRGSQVKPDDAANDPPYGPSVQVCHCLCPFGVPGDRLYVRETWCSERPKSRGGPVGYAADGVCGYWDATGMFCPHGRLIEAPGYKACFPAEGARTFGMKGYGGRWRPSIHMPRWASRITLEVVSVRVERLQDITEADAKAEGVEPYRCPQADALMNAVGGGMKPIPYTSGFANLWNEINGKSHPWSSNPWVWVVEFRRVMA